MVKILMILGGLGEEGITNSVLTYLENINLTDLDMTLGIAGESDIKALERVKKLNIKIKFLPGRNTKAVRYFFYLYKLVKKEKYEIIHVHGNSATLGLDMFAAKLGGVKVRIAHSRNTSCTHPFIDKLMRPVFYKTYTTGFACGEEAGKWLFGKRKFTIIPNGKKLDRFLFSQIKRDKIRELYNCQNKVIVGHVGVFSAQKNHKYLIKIFNELCKYSTKYELWLFGADKGTLKDIKNQIYEYHLEDKVRFMGFHSNIEEYLSAMDIMVFPSYYEGLPNVVIEWQISGLPCFLADTITKECKIMDNVSFISLNDSVTEWADAIENCEIKNRNFGKELIIKKMKQTGFDISENAERLRQEYIKLGSGNQK